MGLFVQSCSVDTVRLGYFIIGQKLACLGPQCFHLFLCLLNIMDKE